MPTQTEPLFQAPGTNPQIRPPSTNQTPPASAETPVPAPVPTTGLGAGGAAPEATPDPAFTTESFTGGAGEGTGQMLDLFADKAPEVTSEQTVQGQLESVLNKDNALFSYARGQAGQYANSRGLMNSDIAAQAGEQAVFDVALPIAQQDAGIFADRAQQEAQFYQNAGLQAFDATIKAGLQAQDHLQRLVELSRQGDINSRLQLEQFGYNWELSERDNINTMAQMALQGDINASLALQAFGFDVELLRQDFGFRSGLLSQELENALSLSAQDNTQWLERISQTHVNTLAEIAAQGQVNQDLNTEAYTRDLQQNYLLAVERRTGVFSAEVTSIYTTQGLTASQQANAVRVARRNYENDVNMLADYYSSSPYWDPNWTVGGLGGSGGSTGPYIPPPTSGGGGSSGGGSGSGVSGNTGDPGVQRV